MQGPFHQQENLQDKPRQRVKIGHALIDNASFADALSAILCAAAELKSRYVVTPNVDHILRLEEDKEFQACYRQADFVYCDGLPLVWASRLLGTPLMERVTGADLMPALCLRAARSNLSVAIIGGPPGSAEKAAERLQLNAPGLNIVWTYCPPIGFQHSEVESKKICDHLNEHKVNLVFLGVGSPKQEKWIYHHRKQLNIGVILGIGAAIEFCAGTLPRAPRWMQRVGLEWVFRTLQDPKRLAPRYLGNMKFLGFVVASIRRQRGDIPHRD